MYKHENRYNILPIILVNNFVNNNYFQLKKLAQFPMQSVIDWYLIATPLFGLLMTLTLVALKLALKGQIQVIATKMRKLRIHQTQRTQNEQITITQKYQSLKTLDYLIRNHTFLQLCLTRKSKNKLPMLLSFSAISALCFFNPNIIINCIVGLPIALSFTIAQACLTPSEPSTSIMDGQAEDFQYIRQEVKQQQSTISGAKRLYIVFGVIGSGIALGMSAILFKNYSNMFLAQLLKNVAVSCCADIFVVRFVGFLLVAFPFSLSSRFLLFIQTQKLKEHYLQFVKAQKDALKNCATMNLSPRKKQSNSPTKIPKAVSKYNKETPDNETLKNAMQMAKKIKKQKNPQSDLLKTLTRLNEIQNDRGITEQYSLNQLFDEESQERQKQKQLKGRETPIAMYDDSENNTIGYRTKRKDTDLVIVEFKKYEEEQQKQQEDEVIQRRAINFLHSNLDFDEEDYNRPEESQVATVENNRLNIVKLLNDCNEVEESQKQRQRRRHQNSLTMTLQRNDLLHVHENQCTLEEGQFQQIDGNSPERRRRKEAEEEGSQYKLKKKAKHSNANAKRRVIKFTSGQPYLEYLPNMLSKDSKHKKSQPINVKPQFDIGEDRRKSIKKSKAKKERFAFGGDQNQYPGALEVEDI